jgi:HemY protein
LIHGAKQTEAGLANYLSAAKMAHNQKAFDRREVYIREARELYPEATEVIGLVEARLIRDEWPQKARAILEVLYRESPKNSVVIAELLAVVAQLKDWSNMATLLPKAKKYRAIKEAEWSEYQVQLLCGQMQAAEDFESLQGLWKSQSRAIKFEANILAEYIEQSLSFDQSKGLSELIEKAITKEWNERLVYQYGRLPAEDIYAHLKQAEKWLAKQDASAVLFLTMGRIACRAQLWSRAHEYFRESLALQPELETFHALAKCYEREGEEQQAALIYKEAISQLPIGTIAQS